MPSFETKVATYVAARYVGQLCKHFGHRLPARQDGNHGEVEFPTGLCRLSAEADHLVMRVETKDEVALGELEQVMEKHLQRFAFRETPEIRWMRSVA
jgi:hypothetical protein